MFLFFRLSSLCFSIQQLHSLALVVLPVQNLLVVNELRALSVGTLGSKMLVLKQLEDVQTLRVSVKIGQKNKVNVPSVQFQPIFTLKTERIVALSSSLDTLNS